MTTTEQTAEGLEREAARLERRAEELDAEAVARFSPQRRGFYEESDRADRYRARGRELHRQAARLRRRGP